MQALEQGSGFLRHCKDITALVLVSSVLFDEWCGCAAGDNQAWDTLTW